LASLIVNSALVYGTIGAIFAAPFVWWGAGRIDSAAARGTIGFRILILPGAVAFWPLMLWLWIRTSADPQ